METKICEFCQEELTDEILSGEGCIRVKCPYIKTQECKIISPEEWEYNRYRKQMNEMIKKLRKIFLIMEIKQEVKVYEVNYKCDECKEGFMNPTGVAYMSNPEQYPHRCSNCGHEKTFPVTYPRTVKEIITTPFKGIWNGRI